MTENTVIDAFSSIPSESPQDTPESPGAPEVPKDAPEALAEPCIGVVGVPATLRLWAPNGDSMGKCQIETFANGRGGHYFICPTRMLLAHGVMVDITVN